MDSFLAQRFVQNIGLLDGNMIENLTFDMCKEMNTQTNTRRISTAHKCGENSRRMSGGGAGGETGGGRRLSLFWKSDGVDESGGESRFLSSLLPSYEHCVKKLNQNNNSTNEMKKVKLRPCNSNVL